jgi:DNA invertase Pin-like site-specific DNA recombinase
MAATVGHLQRLSSHGVSFHSFAEEHLSTDSELVRNILLATLASLAKLEREKISQRRRLASKRARAMGKPLGRPTGPSKSTRGRWAMSRGGAAPKMRKSLMVEGCRSA